MSDDQRTAFLVEVLHDAFADLAAADPAAFRTKYRKMAASPWAFYRGSACVFYADLAEQDEPWAQGDAARVWVQGDLHAENYGTYMDGSGVLVFDVNDFDEAYLAPFTWDLRRMVASVALLSWSKALPDEVIDDLLATYVRSYLDQVRVYAEGEQDEAWSLRLDTARGAVRSALLDAQLSTRVGLLERRTVVRDGARQMREGPHVRRLDDEERQAVEAAYLRYLETIPGTKRRDSISYALKDVVGTGGFGIGSAGLPSYSVLVEGHTQALENDVVLTLKQGGTPSISRVRPDARAREAFEHEGHRTAVSQRALQAHSDPWLGWTRMEGGPHDGVGFVVAELSPYEADLSWDDLTEPDELEEVLAQLGRATAKIHCVSDVDDPETPLVDVQVEDAVLAAVRGREDDLVADLQAFAHSCAARVRADHALFVDAFRAGRIPGVDPSGRTAKRGGGVPGK